MTASMSVAAHPDVRNEEVLSRISELASYVRDSVRDMNDLRLRLDFVRDQISTSRIEISAMRSDVLHLQQRMMYSSVTAADQTVYRSAISQQQTPMPTVRPLSMASAVSEMSGVSSLPPEPPSASVSVPDETFTLSNTTADSVANEAKQPAAKQRRRLKKYDDSPGDSSDNLPTYEQLSSVMENLSNQNDNLHVFNPAMQSISTGTEEHEDLPTLEQLNAASTSALGQYDYLPRHDQPDPSVATRVEEPDDVTAAREFTSSLQKTLDQNRAPKWQNSQLMQFFSQISTGQIEFQGNQVVRKPTSTTTVEAVSSQPTVVASGPATQDVAAASAFFEQAAVSSLPPPEVGSSSLIAQFMDFKFDADPKFQKAVGKLQQENEYLALDESQRQDWLLKLQVKYFDRNVEKVGDQEQFVSLVQSSRHHVPISESTSADAQTVGAEIAPTVEIASQLPVIADASTAPVQDKPTPGGDPYPQQFLQTLALVQSGAHPNDIRKVNDKPNPKSTFKGSQSTKKPSLKPWERKKLEKQHRDDNSQSLPTSAADLIDVASAAESSNLDMPISDTVREDIPVGGPEVAGNRPIDVTTKE
jgi:hypothetical protein